MRTYRYNGPEYVPERDNQRLDSQLSRILGLMLDGQWRTLQQIGDTTGDPPASVSAQLRHLRKERFGSHIVNRQYVGGGLYKYRVEVGNPFIRRALAAGEISPESYVRFVLHAPA